MNKVIKKNQKRMRRISRVRAKVRGAFERPRLSVFRSLAHISAQIIDDATGKTVASARDIELDSGARKKTEAALLVGKLLAERAQKKGVTKVVFDRRDKKYHGRVRALAEGARAGGLVF